METRKLLQDLTVQDVETIAQKHAEPYEPMFKKVARQAFFEGVLWAQKVSREGLSC